VRPGVLAEGHPFRQSPPLSHQRLDAVLPSEGCGPETGLLLRITSAGHRHH